MRSITRMSWAEKIEKLISLGGGGGEDTSVTHSKGHLSTFIS